MTKSDDTKGTYDRARHDQTYLDLKQRHIDSQARLADNKHK